MWEQSHACHGRKICANNCVSTVLSSSGVNRPAVNTIISCLREEGDKVKEACHKSCGPTDAFEEQAYASDEDNNSQRSRLRMVRLTSSKCSYVKCFLQCSRKEYSKVCPKVGDSETPVGDFIGDFYDRLIKASREELTALDSVTNFIQRARLLECSFMHNPTEVFDAPVAVGRTGARLSRLFDNTMDSIQSFLNGFLKEFALR
uniref:CPG4 domain-containing protein n=1 Tax=Steinernema glaseri TaxID=37863 RepID=A0A1I8AEI4_9BILA